MIQAHPLSAGLHVGVRGAGAPVVALHGSASTGGQWRSLTGYLEGRFRVFTPDLPGYGRSAASEGGLAADAAAIGGLIEFIGEPVHLVGHGFGGAVALKLAAARPRALRSLTLIEPAAFHLLRDGWPSDRRLYDEAMELAREMAAAGDREAGMARFVDYWTYRGAWARTSPRLRRFLAGCFERVMSQYRAIAGDEGRRADLRGIGCPTLALMGLESPAPSLRVTEAVAEALPRAVLRLLPWAGHLAPLTDPHLVDPMIADHLLAADRGVRQAPAIAA